MTPLTRQATGYARVLANIVLHEESGRPVIVDRLFTRYTRYPMTEADFTAYENELANTPRPAPTSESSRVEVVGTRGIRVVSAQSGAMPDALGSVALSAEFGVEPDTQLVRIILDGKVLEELTRPAAAPKIEALVLSKLPLKVALRVDGAKHLTWFMLTQKGANSRNILQGVGGIEPGSAGAAPCWVVLPNLAREQVYDPTLPIELGVSNVFDSWSLHFGVAPNDSTTTQQIQSAQ
jgi:hypothetical protein